MFRYWVGFHFRIWWWNLQVLVYVDTWYNMPESCAPFAHRSNNRNTWYMAIHEHVVYILINYQGFLIFCKSNFITYLECIHRNIYIISDKKPHIWLILYEKNIYNISNARLYGSLNFRISVTYIKTLIWCHLSNWACA